MHTITAYVNICKQSTSFFTSLLTDQVKVWTIISTSLATLETYK